MNLSPKIKIQPGRECDVNDIHHLLEELADSIDMKDKMKSVPANIVQYGFSSNPLFQTLLAKHEGNVIGLCLYFFTYSSWMGAPGIYIQDLFVKKKYRKQNVGKKNHLAWQVLFQFPYPSQQNHLVFWVFASKSN